MNDNFVNALSLVGLAGIGAGVGGYGATVLAAAEIVAISTPLGALLGAMTLVGIAVGAMEEANQRKDDD